MVIVSFVVGVDQLTLSPQLVEEATLFHFIQETPIDEVLDFDLFCPRVDSGNFIQDRLEPFVVHLQLGFKNFDLAVVSRIKDLSVG